MRCIVARIIALVNRDWGMPLVREWYIDCRDVPLEKVVEHAPWNRLMEPPRILLHPDLWYDGGWRWVE